MFDGFIEVTKDLTFPDWFGGEDHTLKVDFQYPVGPPRSGSSTTSRYLILIPQSTGVPARRYIKRDLLREWFRKGYIKII